MRNKFIETHWMFEIDGRQIRGERSEHNNMTLYTIIDGDHRVTMFRERELEPLRQFLAVMDSSPGTKMTRCRHCDELLKLIPDGRWVGLDDGDENCPENDESGHEPRPDEYDDED